MNQTIVHLSDLHYGKPFQYALEPILLREVKALAPDLVVVSGDLTQRAQKRQFQQAKAFLERLPRPGLVIPGNHDVPIYNVFARLFRTLESYKTYIRPSVDMVVRSGEILAVGANSAYGWTNDGGRLTQEQLSMAQKAFAEEPQADIKILVTHHHFVCPPGVHQSSLPETLLPRFAEWAVELVLTGHTHLTHVEQRSDGLVLLQSGTATATRWKKLEKRVNSFNVIFVSPAEIAIQVREYVPSQQTYAAMAEYVFSRNVR
jgi:3',5'-cyclic AMP phosphodiesterase CpdA